MTQEELWNAKYYEVIAFIEMNKRNPSKYDTEERGKYVNWLRHTQKQMNAGLLKPERVVLFKKMLEEGEKYRRVNQYE